jgi:hypothetical protein
LALLVSGQDASSIGSILIEFQRNFEGKFAEILREYLFFGLIEMFLELTETCSLAFFGIN